MLPGSPSGDANGHGFTRSDVTDANCRTPVYLPPGRIVSSVARGVRSTSDGHCPAVAASPSSLRSWSSVARRVRAVEAAAPVVDLQSAATATRPDL